MRLLSSLALVLSFSGLALSLPPSDPKLKVKQSVNAPSGWEIHGVPPPNHPIELRIGLSQPNIHVLEHHLLQVSDPDHPRYGQHLSKQEVEGIVAPHPESIRLIDEWLAGYGIQEEDISRSPAQDWVIVTIPVGLAEQLLGTTYHTWKHTASGDALVRTTSYSLPEHLHSHVDVLQPTTTFARWGALKSTIYWPDGETEVTKISQNVAPVVAGDVTVDPACNVTITIDCLQQLYNLKGYKVQEPKKNSIGITGYLEEFANKKDLQLFYKDQRPDAVGSSFEFISVKGGQNSQNASEAGIEANLDVQFAFGLSFPTRSIFYSTAGRPPFIPDTGFPNNTNEPYADWLDFVLSHPSPPLVISTSYGDDEQTVPEDYARRTCQQFMQLGARGVSLTFSSGDGGVGDGEPNPANQTCFTNDGRNKTEFIPLFPASCPYVTAVGGTVNVPEIAVFFSGGGFSNYFERPSYQSKVVDDYLGKLPKGLYKGLFNPKGRKAIPDVAAQGRRFRVFVSGEPISIGGTSASSPTFAGVVALLNDARLAAGKSSLGFLNPLLYSKGLNAFNDITEGNNPGCGTPGFNATKGWDPASLAGSTIHGPPRVKERIFPPRGWVQHARAPPDHKIELRIGLPQPNFNELERHLYEVSDPFHERYGQHLSKQQVEELVAPHPESIDSVTEWLASHGLGESDIARSPAKDWILVTVPVSVAEKLLDTTYHVWKHLESGDQLVRTTSYSIPEHLHAHVDLVQPTIMFARFKGMRTSIHSSDAAPPEYNLKYLKAAAEEDSAVDVDPSCNSTITVSCLQQLYNAVGYTPSADIGNSIGITGYLEQFANIQDLQSFYAEQRPDALNTSFEFISVKGGLNSQNLSEAGAEANLDVQFAFGLSYPIESTFYSTAGRPPFNPDATTPENTNEPYNDWIDFALAQENTPLVISTSYGEAEQTVPESYARRACAGFAQLGARGVSLFFSSGDGGVGDGNPDPETQQCITNDGKNATKFMPSFPASCPYVTAVGGTVNVPEVAVDFSGGGFSDYWPRPSYQEEAVQAYLDNLPEGLYDGLYNRSGRAFPDVAAQGRNFRIWLRGNPRSIGGTSASAPAFAGIVALLNDARLKDGQSSLGFLNPLIYSKGVDGFNDITAGNNPGCGTDGFNVKEHIFPPTGWVQHSRAPPDHKIALRIGLPQANFHELERHLYEISDPLHKRYGQHLSKEEVEALVAPRSESINLVTEYLMSHGLSGSDIESSPAKDWIFVTVPITIAEQLLNTTYHVWNHNKSGDQLVRTTSYSIPSYLHSHVDVIQPTTVFSRFSTMRTTIHTSESAATEFNLKSLQAAANGDSAVEASCNSTITIACLQQLYNATGYKPSPGIGNSIGITGFIGQYANIQDLQSFYAEQRPDALNSSFETILVKGEYQSELRSGLNSQNLSEAGDEANLDVQFGFGLSHPIEATFYSTAGRPPFKPDLLLPENNNEPYNDWIDFALAQENVPLVISTSYGEDEQTGARGISLLISSGDGGVGDGQPDPPQQQCATNDGRNATRFMPGFPASCPYVTAVGATTRVPEVAASFSGGGFSDYWPRPSYQEQAVKTYLDKLPEGMYPNLYNQSGRAFPDVAAQGARFRVWSRGKPGSVSGTSAAAPAFAAFVALLNDARLKKGQNPLGFLNPLLYSKGLAGFNDITEGSNPGCGTAGFNATEGWDPGETYFNSANERH
ncbi:hypothetical protein V5O48_001294 [Marasmius crinis-equi]|uniref:tripeptidyl-peptidase II n=1 Tax=Marasmius crinis-equi TaxID=585013 RepID=A0ABR3FZ60_9AGAR